MKNITTEQFKQDVFNLVGDEYIVLGEYVNTNTPILMRHETCGLEWSPRPNDFKRGTRCPKCAGVAKKNTEQFKKEVSDLVGEEYIVLGEYINDKSTILMRHNICGFEWSPRPGNFKNGTRCPECTDSAKAKTTKQFKKEVSDLVGDEYKVLGEYVNAHTPILMRHNTCGHKWSPRPSNFKNNGCRCSKCYGNLKGSTEQFKKEVSDLVGDEYTVLGEYINVGNPILMRHNACGHKWSPFPSSFKNNGCRCPKCAGNLKGSTEQFKKEVFNLVGDEYIVLGEYVNTNTPILMRHNICGHEWSPIPNDFKNDNTRCPKCSSNACKATEQFKKEVFNLVGDEYIVLGEYVNANTPIFMRHETCGFEWSPIPSNFTRGTRCPKCSIFESKGVKIVKKSLKKRQITCTYEKTYDKLKGVRFLRFDFCLPETNDAVTWFKEMIIEFDGMQHFRATIWEKEKDIILQRQEAFERLMLQHQYDLIKNQYCEDNLVPLLRIRYDQANIIDELIDDFLDRPEWYVEHHNKDYPADELYYEPFYKSIEKYLKEHVNEELLMPT